MFGSIGGFFRDIVAPIGLAFIPTVGPYLAAAYSGIKTGIQTGSPLAGLGSAGLSCLVRLKELQQVKKLRQVWDVLSKKEQDQLLTVV